MENQSDQLISYIAPAAPATRRPGKGDEPFIRPEIGFTPNWYYQSLEIKFDRKWNTDPAFRRETLISMCNELRCRFPGTKIGRIDESDNPLDLLTGTYGCTNIAAIYGIPIIYSEDNWPNCAHQYMIEEELNKLEPPNLDDNHHFQNLL